MDVDVDVEPYNAERRLYSDDHLLGGAGPSRNGSQHPHTSYDAGAMGRRYGEDQENGMAHHKGFRATSSATLNSILTIPADPIPLLGTGKRKASGLAEQWGAGPTPDVWMQNPGGGGSSSSKNGLAPSLASRTTPTPPNAAPPTIAATPPGTSDPSEQIACICGITIDDGFSIACDVCSRWCHTACFNIVPTHVPDEFACWVCRGMSPTAEEDLRRSTRRMQGVRLLGWPPSEEDLGPNWGVDASAMVDAGQRKEKGRRLSPGMERKSRSARGSGSAGSGTTFNASEGNKRKRRPSAAQPIAPLQPPLTAGPSGLSTVVNAPGDEDVQVAVSGEGPTEAEEPWAQNYVHIVEDLITDDETRTRLRKHAMRWRGVTALAADSPEDPPYPSTTPVQVSHLHNPPPIAVKPLSSSIPTDTSSPGPGTTYPALAPSPFTFNAGVLPPSYAVHTTQPIPSRALITPFTSHITPSATYLADPLNAYAHLGMPKPFVHLLGPPLGVALDARGVGGKERYVRWGCRPNAVLRPVLCDRARSAGGLGKMDKGKGKARECDVDEDDEASLAFGVFALRDLKEGEEVVLGWEWDDGNIVHKLPALLKTPNMFAPSQIPHIKNQMANLLHALSGSFVACACGAKRGACISPAGANGDTSSSGMSNERHADHPDDDDTTEDEILGDGWSSISRRPRAGSVRRSRTRTGKEDQCVLAAMSGFVGRGGADDDAEDGWRDSHVDVEAETEVDLGPLVGAKRGFRTRERVRFGGGFGGVEPVPEEAERSPELGRNGVVRNGYDTGRGRDRRKTRGQNSLRPQLVDEDVDVDVEMVDEAGGNGVISYSHPHRNPNRISSTTPLEPRPPDPISPPDRTATTNQAQQDEDRIPPKMRKRWMHREIEAKKDTGTLSPSSGSGSPGGVSAAGAEIKETDARMKSVGDGMDVDTDLGPVMFKGSRVGLGIRFELQEPDHPSNGRVCDEDHRRPSDESTTLMPPPPMPASLDPTTISSISLSSQQHLLPRSPKSPSSPRSPPSPITHSPRSPRSPQRFSLSPQTNTVHLPSTPVSVPAHSQPIQFARSTCQTSPNPASTPTSFHAHPSITTAAATASSPSPLVSFANLSLLSPALLDQVRAQIQAQSQPNSSTTLASVIATSTSSISELPFNAPTNGAVNGIQSSPTASQVVDALSAEESMPITGPMSPRSSREAWSPLQRREHPQPLEESDRVVSSSPEGIPHVTEQSSEPSSLDYPLENVEDIAIKHDKSDDQDEECEVGIRVEFVDEPMLSPCSALRSTMDVEMNATETTIPMELDIQSENERVDDDVIQEDVAVQDPVGEQEEQPQADKSRKRKRGSEDSSRASSFYESGSPVTSEFLEDQKTTYELVRHARKVKATARSWSGTPHPQELEIRVVKDEDCVMDESPGYLGTESTDNDGEQDGESREEDGGSSPLTEMRSLSNDSTSAISTAPTGTPEPPAMLPVANDEIEASMTVKPAEASPSPLAPISDDPITTITDASSSPCIANTHLSAAVSIDMHTSAESSPQPEAQPKVKLSFKDFVLRKKQQKEKEKEKEKEQREKEMAADGEVSMVAAVETLDVAMGQVNDANMGQVSQVAESDTNPVDIPDGMSQEAVTMNGSASVEADLTTASSSSPASVAMASAAVPTLVPIPIVASAAPPASSLANTSNVKPSEIRSTPSPRPPTILLGKTATLLRTVDSKEGLQAKQELVDQAIPAVPVAVPVSLKPPSRFGPPTARSMMPANANPMYQRTLARSISPIGADPSSGLRYDSTSHPPSGSSNGFDSNSHTRRTSREDGEIGEIEGLPRAPPLATPASASRPHASSAAFGQGNSLISRITPARVTSPYTHIQSPPTQPRFFATNSSPTPTSNGNSSNVTIGDSHHRSPAPLPFPPASSSSAPAKLVPTPPPIAARSSGPPNLSERPPPRAPRALRQSMLSGSGRGGGPAMHDPSGSSGYAQHPPPLSARLGPIHPRGTNSDARDRDRDRDTERDRDWEHRHHRGSRRGRGSGFWSGSR